MASKKYSFLAGLFCLLASYGFSQTTTGSTTSANVSFRSDDSSVIPSRRMPQYTEFMNGTYNYPAKPRNQWEIGLKGGAFTVSGDVPAVFPTLTWGAHIRKAFGYVFSLRLEYINGVGKGLSYNSSSNYGKNTAWSTAGYNTLRPGGGRTAVNNIPTYQYTYGFVRGTNLDRVFYNYRTRVQDLSLEGVVTINNIRFHKANTGINVYGFGGIGGSIYKTRINSRDGNFNSYASKFAAIATANQYTNRKSTREALRDILDDTYETRADGDENDISGESGRRPKLFGETFKPSGTLGAGIAIKISKRFNIALEDRVTLIKTDLLDGQRWQEAPFGDAALTSDYDSYNNATIGLNYNIGAKSVEPLYWLNPLDYAYSEIRNPRLMRLPKPVLPDSDGDGVTDQFDQEVTPQGCPVDSHGVSLDTDGDGVPDCRDKEKITPSICQPVDADGVGKCPVACPDSTCPGWGKPAVNECANTLGSLPSVMFTGNSNKLSNDAKALLASVAARLRQSGGCRVVVTGYGNESKLQQQRSWDRVNAVITYMVEKEGISQDRFIFNFAQAGGDANTVDLRAAAEGEEGQSTVPAPYSNLRGR